MKKQWSFWQFGLPSIAVEQHCFDTSDFGNIKNFDVCDEFALVDEYGEQAVLI